MDISIGITTTNSQILQRNVARAFPSELPKIAIEKNPNITILGSSGA